MTITTLVTAYQPISQQVALSQLAVVIIYVLHFCSISDGLQSHIQEAHACNIANERPSRIKSAES